jgi:hypothetical protein
VLDAGQLQIRVIDGVRGIGEGQNEEDEARILDAAQDAKAGEALIRRAVPDEATIPLEPDQPLRDAHQRLFAVAGAYSRSRAKAVVFHVALGSPALLSVCPTRDTGKDARNR